MRVAVVYDCLFPYDNGGGERVYGAIAEEFVARGFDVEYLTRDRRGAAMGDLPFEVHTVASGRVFDDDGNRTAAGALRFAAGVFRHLVARRHRYDVVIASGLPVLTLLAARAALMGSRTRLVADWLEIWPLRKWRAYSGAFAGPVAWVLQWFGAHATHHHTVNSSFTASRLTSVRPGARPITLGLVGLVEYEGLPRPADDPPFALFVGRLIPDKGAALLPPALAHARASLPSLTAVIVGVGPERVAVERAAAASSVSDVVVFLGRVSDEVLDDLMARAALLVNPSAREGFGLVVAEAAAHGVPSVLVDGPDNAAVDLIEPGTNGFVAPDASPAALGEAMLRAIRAGPALREATYRWYERARIERGLSRSLDRLLSTLGLPR